MVNTMASGLLIRSPALSARSRAGIGDVLQNGGRLVAGAARCRQPGARGGQFPCAAHLQRVQQQHDAVGRGQVADVLLDGLLVRRSSPAVSKNDSSVCCGSGCRAGRPAGEGRGVWGRSLVKRNTSGGRLRRRGRRGRRGQPRLAVQRPLVVAGEPLPGVVVRAGDGRVELLPGPVHQLMDQHGHEHGLARLLGADRHDQVAADLAEVDREPAVADRADPDAGLALAVRAGGRVAAAAAAKAGGSAPVNPVRSRSTVSDLLLAALPAPA